MTSFEEASTLKKITSEGNVILLNGIIGQTEKEIYNIFKSKIIPVINSLNELKEFYKYSKKFNVNHKLTLSLRHWDKQNWNRSA